MILACVLSADSSGFNFFKPNSVIQTVWILIRPNIYRAGSVLEFCIYSYHVECGS